MATFTSKYPNLIAWHGDKKLKFTNGVYRTDDKEEIDFLKTIKDITFVEKKEPYIPTTPNKKK